MIRLRQLDVLSPHSVSELVETLAQSAGDTRIMGGGTDLVPNMKHELLTPKRLVWLGKVGEIQQIRLDAQNKLRLGAMCILSDIAMSHVVQRLYPSLVNAIRHIASPAIRNRATLGGNLCLDTRCYFYNESESWRVALCGCMKFNLLGGKDGEICHAAPGRSVCSAVFSSDLAPLLIALDASVRLVSRKGERIIQLNDLYADDGMHHLTLMPGEILAEVLLPAPPSGLCAAHRKVRDRASIDYPLVNVGIATQRDAEQVLCNVHIIVGAVASAPIRARDAEGVLEGRRATAHLLKEAASAAAERVTPVANIGGSVNYRRSMVRVLVRQVLSELVVS